MHGFALAALAAAADDGEFWHEQLEDQISLMAMNTPPRANNVRELPSHQQSWKWKMAPGKTMKPMGSWREGRGGEASSNKRPCGA